MRKLSDLLLTKWFMDHQRAGNALPESIGVRRVTGAGLSDWKA